MEIFDSIIIATTLHEPSFRLEKSFEKALSFIQNYNPHIIVSCTSETSSKVIKTLQNEGISAKISPNDSQIETYLYAVRSAVNVCEKKSYQNIFYVDFDRLLHWINTYPDELLDVMKRSLNYDLLHIGRSERAFETHPETQKDTESIINHIGSKVLGLSKDIDLISVSYIFTRELAKILFNYTYNTSVGFYCTWPVILWTHAKNPNYIKVEGQEWETPDRYPDEVDKQGYDQWLNNFQSFSEWKKRVRFIDECVRELMKITNCKFLKQ